MDGAQDEFKWPLGEHVGDVVLSALPQIEATPGVRAVTPEGQVEEVPVPMSGEAHVFISGQPRDLRALQRGIYIRAYMTPTGETRILGAPSE